MFNFNGVNFNDAHNLEKFRLEIDEISSYFSELSDLNTISFSFDKCSINKDIIRKLIQIHKLFSDKEFIIVLIECNFTNVTDDEILDDDAYNNTNFKIKIINNGEDLFGIIKILEYFKNIYYIFIIAKASIFLTIINKCIINGNNNIQIIFETQIFGDNIFKDEEEIQQFQTQIIKFLNLQDVNRSIKFNCNEEFDSLSILLNGLLNTIKNRKKLGCLNINQTKKFRKLRRQKHNITENVSKMQINDDNFGRLYQLFNKRYQDSLFMDYKLEPDKVKRAELYIKSIIKLIYNEESTLETFMKYLISTAYNFKLRISTSTFPRQYNLVSYHGDIRKDMKKVPADCVLVFLSPFNRLLIQDNLYILNLLKSEQWTDEYYTNPLCYGKNTLNFLFTNSEIYLPGQYYPDMNLSMKEEDIKLFANTMGIYQSKNKYLQEVEKLHVHPYKSELYFESILSSIIDKYKFKGFVFIQSCRSADRLLQYSDTLTTDLYRLTHLMSILNKSIWFKEDNNAYEECDEILKMPKGITIGNYTKNNELLKNKTLKTLANVRKNANNSLSITSSNLQRIGFSKKLIIILDTLDKDNLASTYENIASELRAYEQHKKRLLSLTIYSALYSVKTKQYYDKYLRKQFNIIDILLSFFIYWQILLDKDEFKDLIDLSSLKKIDYIFHLSFGGCNLSTPLLEKLLDFLKEKAYSLYIEIFLQNNKITNIPLELLNIEYFNIDHLKIEGNDLSFEIVDSSKYLDKTNIDDNDKLPKDLNINVYETLKKYYAVKQLEEQAYTLENTLFTELEQKEQQVYKKPQPFNNLTSTFMQNTHFQKTHAQNTYDTGAASGGFFSKNGIINSQMLKSKLNKKRKNKLTKLLNLSNRK